MFCEWLDSLAHSDSICRQDSAPGASKLFLNQRWCKNFQVPASWYNLTPWGEQNKKQSPSFVSWGKNRSLLLFENRLGKPSRICDVFWLNTLGPQDQQANLAAVKVLSAVAAVNANELTKCRSVVKPGSCHHTSVASPTACCNLHCMWLVYRIPVTSWNRPTSLIFLKYLHENVYRKCNGATYGSMAAMEYGVIHMPKGQI